MDKQTVVGINSPANRFIRAHVIIIESAHYDKSLDHYTGHWLCIALGARSHPPPKPIFTLARSVNCIQQQRRHSNSQHHNTHMMLRLFMSNLSMLDCYTILACCCCLARYLAPQNFRQFLWVYQWIVTEPGDQSIDGFKNLRDSDIKQSWRIIVKNILAAEHFLCWIQDCGCWWCGSLHKHLQ